MTPPDYGGGFTPAERRAALVTMTATFLGFRPPKYYPPPKEGAAKSVHSQDLPFACAVWGARAVAAIESAMAPKDDSRALAAKKEGASDGPF